MNLNELKELMESYTSTIGSAVTNINNLYSSTVREIKSRVSFGYKVKSQSTTYASGYYSYTFYSNYTNMLYPLQNIERGIKRLIVKTEADTVPIATAISSSIELDINLNSNASTILRNGFGSSNVHIDVDLIKVETGIKQNDGTFLWWTVGYYKIKTLKETIPGCLKITAYDYMYELSDKKITINSTSNISNGVNLFQCSAWNTPDDLSGLMDATTRAQLEAIPITREEANKMRGHTVREVLAWMAAKVGKLAHFSEGNYAGTLSNIVLRIDDMSGFDVINENYLIKPEYKIEFEKEDRIQVNKICIGSEEYSLSFEEQSGTTYYFDCPIVNSSSEAETTWASILSSLWSSMPSDNEFSAFEYETGELKTTGNILWDIGQTLSFYDSYGIYHRILICGYVMNLSSGLSMTIYSKAPQTEFTI